MIDPEKQQQIFEQILFISTGQPLAVSSIRFISGGCINNAIQLNTDQGRFFLKWNESKPEEFFAVEARGLELLSRCDALRTPEVLGVGRIENTSYLLLEYIESSYPRDVFWQRLGEGLAAQHQRPGRDFGFGLDFNNYIGGLRQSNEPQQDGISFFIEKRLRVQAGLAFYEGKVDARFLDRMEALYERLPELLPEEPPALLHGDLWSGNFLSGPQFMPYILDPAVYYGSREAELAFTRLFGGFDPVFYSAYESVYPLTSGFSERAEIYNLYPLLVHTNLFDTSYLSGVERVLNKYIPSGL
ncbi:MAG: fructosamine kinase family protein [Bernardetiaceae bacterium]